MNDDQRSAVMADIYLLLFLALFSVTAILMTLTANLTLNTIYLGLTLVMILMTYFFGAITGLTANLIFIFLQAIVMIYINTTHHATIPMIMIFWLVMPLLLSATFYGMTRHLTQLQVANAKLRGDIMKRGAFDERTDLRTTVAYIQDAQVFIETNRRFQLPVTTVIIRIRYFNEIKRMMNEQQFSDLLRLTSDTIASTTRDNDITYSLDQDNPTWAVLLFSDTPGAQIAANRLKSAFDKRLKESVSLNSLEILLVVGIASWDADKMKSPYDLMNTGIKETEYDVAR
ncbi:diguanylate cyclase [Lactiplantibacillus mudanjiangensis]|uniref:GGDEF domain-containing protein [Lactobacillus sp.] n=1 Tax=Lactiplantibacillus mudanjiangensis TaxID=1296538 RepID=A0A660E1C2_9LACO|nr:diguanylate cyclase [Lactiplantibacillus mudanjiangensis]VDG17927.1 GGDEF domain-containing protein [Lactobacillus sp.] [Lactiplantibacillus mudanjiangensis]VDG24354.1 GGDEF domain-containing protein [Lactobacillus sp.] [Lactiplantibacillus mudanjiangensis]VDG28341.1 GGDEF domain-containing protein [Lactobacillus sp.] [Lactiplantibacillus mudanjiangensis]VDG32370.1 GGDEF domain-containing protein [Lactobacillus sp.] [Lactiplantibacillus mudanjiangensis]